jgi:tellurite resistance protein
MNGLVRIPTVPASYFSVTLGLTGLGADWRHAHAAWGYPAAVGEMVQGFATLVWAYLLVGYIAKWIWARESALAEVRDPIQCCFIGLVGVATMLVAGAVLPYSRAIALALLTAGAGFTALFGIWRSAAMWSSERSDNGTTAVMYLPVVAGGFVTATLLGAMGWRDWGQLAFGAALFSWLAIESVLLRRLYIGPALPAPLRPTMGVQLAPPAVGLVAYLSVSAGEPGLVAHAMLGYALLQSLVLLVRLRWVFEQPFVPAYWAFSFAVTALGQAPLIMLAHAPSAPAQALAPVLFVFANVIIAILLFCTIKLILNNKVAAGPKVTPAR